MEKTSSVTTEEILHLLADMTWLCGQKVNLLAKPFQTPSQSLFSKYRAYGDTLLEAGGGQSAGSQLSQSAEVFNSSLVLTKICKLVMKHFKICTIAGGYPSYLSKDTNEYNDIDFFIPVINEPTTKTLVTHGGRIDIVQKKCSCLTYNNIKSLIEKLRSKQSKPLTLHPLTYLKVGKVVSSCERDNTNKYILSSKFLSLSQFPHDI